MKKLIAIALAAVLVLTLGAGVALAGKGNNVPSGKHYNLNIIGVPNEMNDNFTGGNGSRIFVLRTGTTKFYVQGGGSYAVLDHDGTDGEVGTGPNPNAVGYAPGIIFPYTGGKWQVDIYVRLLGPKTSEVKWKSYSWDGDDYIEFASFILDRTDTKFQLKTGQLLADGFEDILWEMYDKKDFRLLQMRIYLTPR